MSKVKRPAGARPPRDRVAIIGGFPRALNGPPGALRRSRASPWATKRGGPPQARWERPPAGSSKASARAGLPQGQRCDHHMSAAPASWCRQRRIERARAPRRAIEARRKGGGRISRAAHSACAAARRCRLGAAPPPPPRGNPLSESASLPENEPRGAARPRTNHASLSGLNAARPPPRRFFESRSDVAAERYLSRRQVVPARGGRAKAVDGNAGAATERVRRPRPPRGIECALGRSMWK